VCCIAQTRLWKANAYKLDDRAPISLFIFLFSMSLLEGLNGEETRERFKNQYFAILFVNWQVWPLFQVRHEGIPPVSGLFSLFTASNKL
jgi:hypothetical protein